MNDHKFDKLDFNIVTIQESMNYGAVLQAYALQEYLSRNGRTAGILDYSNKDKERIKKNIKNRVYDYIHKKVRNFEAENTREEYFKEFREQKLKLNSYIRPRIFLTGSDQVWKSSKEPDRMYFLQFLDNDVYRASYASSIGEGQIRAENEKLFKRFIQSYDKVSVREKKAAEEIRRIAGVDCTVNVDPVLLHDSTFYDKLGKGHVRIPNEPYIFLYILHVPKNINSFIRWLKKDRKSRIILDDPSGVLRRFINHDDITEDLGPIEFLQYIKNAQAVVTTSFHGTAFSVIYKKEFYTIVDYEKSFRISNLVDQLSLPYISETESRFQRYIPNWEQLYAFLSKERKKTEAYIENIWQEAINNIHKKKNFQSVVGHEEMCTGCMLCGNVCEKDAISFKLDNKGFYKPNIDLSKCVNCGKCISTCPQTGRKHNLREKKYYGWNKDKEVLARSSSGGAYSALADKILSDGGVVCGCRYTDDFMHVIFDTTEDVEMDLFRKSKYIFSEPRNIYKRVAGYLSEGRRVLFSGTPCQCAAMRNYARDNDLLVCCDFVCGGMISLKFWQEHKMAIEEKNGKLEMVDFRSKKRGWGKLWFEFTCTLSGENLIREYEDSYYSLFFKRELKSEPCKNCDYQCAGASDITIGDFWTYREENISGNNEGMSVIYANTKLGQNLIDESEMLLLNEIPTYKYEYRKDSAITQSKKRLADRFYHMAENSGFETAAHRIYHPGKLYHIMEYVKTRM